MLSTYLFKSLVRVDFGLGRWESGSVIHYRTVVAAVVFDNDRFGDLKYIRFSLKKLS
jgi:hypothetical protein